jgi:hypothetical protein
MQVFMPLSPSIQTKEKKFVNQHLAGLYKMLNTEHGTATAYTSQCNAQIERANQTITKYLASFVNDDTLNWENNPAPMFCYNTSFHRSTKQIPHFMTFGFEPNMPSFPAANVERKFYGDANGVGPIELPK